MLEIIIPCIILLAILFEFRLKKPDQIILSEKDNKISIRKGKFYPKHFSLSFSLASASSNMKVDCETKGRIQLETKLILTVAPSLQFIQNLIKVGGWDTKATNRALKETEIVIYGLVKDFCGKFEIDELSSEKVYHHIQSNIKPILPDLGLELISLSVQSIDTVDKSISEALRKKEEARIKESSERSLQQARILTAQLKIDAEEKIAFAEHELQLKKLELKKIEEMKEAELSLKRMEEETKRKKIALEFEKQELELLKNNPELLILSPQITKLAEASQALKNAKTVVNISPGEIDSVNEVTGVIQSFFQNIIKKNNNI